MCYSIKTIKISPSLVSNRTSRPWRRHVHVASPHEQQNTRHRQQQQNRVPHRALHGEHRPRRQHPTHFHLIVLSQSNRVIRQRTRHSVLPSL